MESILHSGLARQVRIMALRFSAFMSGRKNIVRFRSVVAFLLMFWCAGTGCLLVSYARSAVPDSAAAAQFTEEISTGASGSMGDHACCKARHKAFKRDQRAAPRIRHANEDVTLTLPSNPAPSGAMSCCPLTSGSIVTASRSQTNDTSSTVIEGSDSLLPLILSTNRPLAVPLRLPNRAHSYLLDCAFLI